MKKILLIGTSHGRDIAMAAAFSKAESALRALGHSVLAIPHGWPDWSSMVHDNDPFKRVIVEKSASSGPTEGWNNVLPGIRYKPEWGEFKLAEQEKREERWRLHKIRLKFAINRKRRKSKRKK